MESNAEELEALIPAEVKEFINDSKESEVKLSKTHPPKLSDHSEKSSS